MFWCNVEHTVKLGIKMIKDQNTFQGHRIDSRTKGKNWSVFPWLLFGTDTCWIRLNNCLIFKNSVKCWLDHQCGK